MSSRAAVCLCVCVWGDMSVCVCLSLYLCLCMYCVCVVGLCVSVCLQYVCSLGLVPPLQILGCQDPDLLALALGKPRTTTAGVRGGKGRRRSRHPGRARTLPGSPEVRSPGSSGGVPREEGLGKDNRTASRPRGPGPSVRRPQLADPLPHLSVYLFGSHLSRCGEQQLQG